MINIRFILLFQVCLVGWLIDRLVGFGFFDSATSERAYTLICLYMFRSRYEVTSGEKREEGRGISGWAMCNMEWIWLCGIGWEEMGSDGRDWNMYLGRYGRYGCLWSFTLSGWLVGLAGE